MKLPKNFADSRNPFLRMVEDKMIENGMSYNIALQSVYFEALKRNNLDIAKEKVYKSNNRL
jgi:hypothetical protein